MALTSNRKTTQRQKGRTTTRTKIMQKTLDYSSLSTHVTLGSRNYAINDRQNEDFYATHPKAVRLLLEIEHFDKSVPIWECACGQGHLSEEMKRLGYEVKSTDLFDRNYGTPNIDFIGLERHEWYGNIITNPPFVFASEFITRALETIPNGNKAAFFLPIRYLEGKARGQIYKYTPPHTIYIPCGRLKVGINGKFSETGSALSFAWFVWLKGHKGETIIKWFN